MKRVGKVAGLTIALFIGFAIPVSLEIAFAANRTAAPAGSAAVATADIKIDNFSFTPPR